MRQESRTYADRRAYIVQAVKKRRHKVKAMAVEYKGGKCQSCGYNRYQGALEFHHLDSSKKSFGLGANGHSRSWVRIKSELDKCILVCANCHREIEAGIKTC